MNDLDKIWLHIALDSPTEADKFIDRVLAKFPLLASQPRMGVQRPEIDKDVFSHAYGNYIIFWHVADDEARFLHVIYGGRELETMNLFMDEL